MIYLVDKQKITDFNVLRNRFDWSDVIKENVIVDAGDESILGLWCLKIQNSWILSEAFCRLDQHNTQYAHFVPFRQAADYVIGKLRGLEAEYDWIDSVQPMDESSQSKVEKVELGQLQTRAIWLVDKTAFSEAPRLHGSNNIANYGQMGIDNYYSDFNASIREVSSELYAVLESDNVYSYGYLISVLAESCKSSQNYCQDYAVAFSEAEAHNYVLEKLRREREYVVRDAIRIIEREKQRRADECSSNNV